MGTKAVLRNDLSITWRQEEDGLVYQVVDPLTGERFEFGEKEWFLLSYSGDESFPPDLIEEFEEKFNTEITSELLESLLDLAMEWGLLTDIDHPGSAGGEVIRIYPSNDDVTDPGDVAFHQDVNPVQRPISGRKFGRGGSRTAQGRSPRRKRSVDDDFDDRKLNWTWFNPGDLFLTLSRYLSPLRYVLFVMPLMLPIAIIVVFKNVPVLIHDHLAFRAPLNLLQVFIFSLFTVNLITQTGRGIICRAMGVNVNGFGIRLILGLLPRFGVHAEGFSRLDKRRQMWSHAAPLIVRLSLFSFCTVFWITTRTNGTHISSMWLMIATISFASLLFGANPFIKSNGYKLLTTWLEMPNLRRRAKRALFSRFKSGQSARSSGDTFALQIYALMGISFWIALLVFLAILSARWLESNFEGTGIFLFLMLVTYFVVHMKRSFKDRRSGTN